MIDKVTSSERRTSAREAVLAVLNGRSPVQTLCFSGLINVTTTGLAAVNVTLAEAHHNAAHLAAVAASSYHCFGFQSAVLPLDLCVEAEALGSRIDFRASESAPHFPVVDRFAAADLATLIAGLPADITSRGRLPLVCTALSQLQRDVGEHVAIGAFIPGPFTLAMYLVEGDALLTGVVDDPAAVEAVLDALTESLIAVGQAYRNAGADFLTIHEMGGSPGYLGAGPFRRLVLPRLQRLIAALPAPRVLSVCGRTNRGMKFLAQAGADALSVDQMCDLAAARQVLGPDAVLLGNLDPVATLANGRPKEVRAAAEKALAMGVDALWPGCDLWPEVPSANMQALMAVAGGDAPKALH